MLYGQIWTVISAVGYFFPWHYPGSGIVKGKLVSHYTFKLRTLLGSKSREIYRGYYMVARRYEFYFRVPKQYFTNERSKWVKYCFCQEKIKFISSSRCVMFFLLYRHADDGVSDDFPKISDHLPKISEDFPKLFRIPDERSRTFSENFRRFPKISEDFRRLPRKTRRCFDDTPTNLSTM